jgi:DNA repair exonuclease SbcCD ATPase subunit
VNAPIRASATRAEYVASRTAKVREDVEKFRASFSDATPRMTNVATLRSTLAGMEEELRAAIEAAGAEWDRAQQARRKTAGQAERRRTIEGLAERRADLRARFSR